MIVEVWAVYPCIESEKSMFGGLGGLFSPVFLIIALVAFLLLGGSGLDLSTLLPTTGA
jgi:hypothetical protein